MRKRIGELFGGIEGREPTPLPRTVEPAQDGVRRIVLHGDAGPPQFRIAYRAPSANDPDFAAFLVLQAVLGASSGVNFLQNDWGTPVGDTALLAGAADELTTWYPPSAQDYVFIVGGFAPDGAEPGAVESAVEARISDARDLVAGSAVLSGAIDEVLDAARVRCRDDGRRRSPACLLRRSRCTRRVARIARARACRDGGRRAARGTAIPASPNSDRSPGTCRATAPQTLTQLL